jgi:hypothetical protein
VLWPGWLQEDIPGIGLWLVGYPAAKTNWRGHALPLADRADNILARLLVEPRLEKGNIVFVVHSLGGLVVKQLIRNADRDSASKIKTQSLLSRARRIAFLGTPHRGALLANVAKKLSFLVRPSAAIHDLPLGDPQLRELDLWYRRFSHEQGIEHLVLAEGRPEKVWGFSLPETLGTIVSPTSADAGLVDLPVSVDESHMTICKPSSRDAEVYALVKEFVSRPFVKPPHATRIVEVLEKNTAQLEELSVQAQQQTAAMRQFTQQVAEGGLAGLADKTILDAEVLRQLERLRKCRLFVGFDVIEEPRCMAERLRAGDLAFASPNVKAKALAWCARLLSFAHPDEAVAVLDSIASPDPELSAIARSLARQSLGQLSEALGALTAFESPSSRGAAFICVVRGRGFQQAHHWLTEAGLTFRDLDSDARFFYIGNALESSAWSEALEAASSVEDADFVQTPALLVAVADAQLAQTVPVELRGTLRQPPMEAAVFPLRSEPENLACRRAAADLYEQAQAVATSLGMTTAADHASDKALWLRLRDPETTAEARKQLGASIRDSATLLRRLNLALQFGVKVDLSQVEREVNRQTALSGGTSIEAAAARFALAFAQDGYADAAAYVDTHREQLLAHIDWKGVYYFEFEALAKAGQIAQAEGRLQEILRRGISHEEEEWLRRILQEVEKGDPVAGRLESYSRSKSLADLRLLVAAYEATRNWEKVCEFGGLLLAQTGDIEDAHRQVASLYNLERLDEVLDVFDEYPALFVRAPKLHRIRAQTLYELGRFRESLDELNRLPEVAQSANSRDLQVNLAIQSGDWERLQGFVEQEWANRAGRDAIELLRSGQLAQLIHAARGRDLVREAAERASEDAKVLLGCYQAAVAGGWEVGRQATSWMEQAARLSSQQDDGPVKKMSFDDFIERQPLWEERESKTWDLLVKGNAPLFAAGQALNRSLLSLFLLPALRSRDESDVRKRPMVYAFSGARSPQNLGPDVVAMDPTALVTAQMLGIVESCLSTFSAIVIPHGTLGWLFEERAKISFHQPSRVAQAREIRRLIAAGQLKAFVESTKAPDRLVSEVGDQLGELLTHASAPKGDDTVQRIVIRGGPIHRASTFLKEEADIAAYEPFLCSTLGLVEKLAQKGVLLEQELEDARAALKLRELPWPSEPEIKDGAVIYLDGTAVSHLASLGLLGRLHRANISVVISRGEVDSADALIAYDAKGEEALAVVDALREHVRAGIESGKIRLGRAVRAEEPEGPKALLAHPSVAILKLVEGTEADAGVCDDRYLNQHAFIGSKPLLTTLDVLDILLRRKAISTARWREARTTLRLANYVLVPLDHSELTALVEAAPISDGALQETGELRALRESILRVRMSNIVQTPKEAGWLNNLIGSILQALKDQWQPGIDEVTAVARSNWLLRIGDVRGWTHVLNEDVGQLAMRYRTWVGLLMVLPITQPQGVKAAYWRWLSTRVLDSIAEEDPETQEFLIRRAKELVSQVIEMDLNETP